MLRNLVYSICSKILIPIVFRILEQFMKRDDTIVLLGSGFNRFTDNSKYLFLYLIQNCKNIRAYYVVASYDEYVMLKDQKLPVVHKHSLENMKLALKSGYIFITHNIDDVFPSVRKDATVVNLWHGTPIKKIGYDSKVENKWIRNKRLTFRKIPYVLWDYVIVSHESLIERQMNSFRKKRESFLPMGLPRNDILFEVKRDDKVNQEYKLKFANKYNFPVESELILYVPTFRPYKQGKAEFIRLISTFNEVYRGSNKRLLVRLHPHDFNLINNNIWGNTVVIVNDYPDVQELLAVSDIMITDYSSIVFDYSILERPVYLFPYDYEQYIKMVELYSDYNEVFKGYYISSDADDIVRNLCDSHYYKNPNFHNNYNCANASRNITKYFNLSR